MKINRIKIDNVEYISHTIPESYAYGDECSVFGIKLIGADGTIYQESDMPIVDYNDILYITGINSTGNLIQISIAQKYGLVSEGRFTLFAKPDSYTDMKLIYSGSSFFTNSFTSLGDMKYTVYKPKVYIDFTTAPLNELNPFANIFPLDSYLQLETDENQFFMVDGLITTNNSAYLYDERASHSEEITFYTYNTDTLQWIEDETRSVNSKSLIMEIKIYDYSLGEYKYLALRNYSLEKADGFTQFRAGLNISDFALSGHCTFRLRYMGNDHFEPTSRLFSVYVPRKSLEINMIDADGKRVSDFDSDLGYLPIDQYVTYSDDFNLSFEVLESRTQNPVFNNTPIWLSLGITPLSDWYDENPYFDNLGDSENFYLWERYPSNFIPQGVPAYYCLHNMNQSASIYSRPIYYPFFNTTDGEDPLIGNWEVVAPHYYMPGVTD